MIALELKYRVLEQKDWATVLFFICFVLIAVNKNSFFAQFKEFTRIIISDKFLKIYKDTNLITSSFVLSMFFIQVISFSLFIYLYLNTVVFESPKNDFILFIQISTALGFFILFKYYIEKIIADVFKIEEFLKQLQYVKVIYRSYIGLLLLPIVIFLFYNKSFCTPLILGIITVALIISLLVSYLISINSNQKALLSKLFYFILYLCTLEIIPYYFIYYLIKIK